MQALKIILVEGVTVHAIRLVLYIVVHLAEEGIGSIAANPRFLLRPVVKI